MLWPTICESINSLEGPPLLGLKAQARVLHTGSSIDAPQPDNQMEVVDLKIEILTLLKKDSYSA